jgi:hypothetical protein
MKAALVVVASIAGFALLSVGASRMRAGLAWWGLALVALSLLIPWGWIR